MRALSFFDHEKDHLGLNDRKTGCPQLRHERTLIGKERHAFADVALNHLKFAFSSRRVHRVSQHGDGRNEG